jgi:HEAT repeat protein
MTGSEKTLATILESQNTHTRVNAAVALLELGDSKCLPVLADILLSDSRDLALSKVSSPGKSLTALRVIPSARQNLESTPVALEMSLHLREALLTKAVELPERDFLALANIIFERQQNDLIPILIEVLINHPTKAVISLLKKQQQKAGAPLVRNYCNLALFRLKEEGPYAANLEQWVTQQRNVDLIRFRPTVPWDVREHESFELTPQETSRLLVETFETFVSMQDDKGINLLIDLIQTGNPKNKYALIGLLMRAIQ